MKIRAGDQLCRRNPRQPPASNAPSSAIVGTPSQAPVRAQAPPRDQALRPGNAVYAVHEIVGVGQADDPDDRQDRAPAAEVERDAPGQEQIAEIAHAPDRCARHRQLAEKTQARAQRNKVIAQAHAGDRQRRTEINQHRTPRNRTAGLRHHEHAQHQCHHQHEAQAASAGHHLFVQAPLVGPVHQSDHRCQPDQKRHQQPAGHGRAQPRTDDHNIQIIHSSAFRPGRRCQCRLQSLEQRRPWPPARRLPQGPVGHLQ